jgi:hypothetical protein
METGIAHSTVDSVMPSFGITGITHCNCFPAKSDGVVKKKLESLEFPQTQRLRPGNIETCLI